LPGLKIARSQVRVYASGIEAFLLDLEFKHVFIVVCILDVYREAIARAGLFQVPLCQSSQPLDIRDRALNFALQNLRSIASSYRQVHMSGP
jgi:hypothetical protein